ncbi:hypothetical protein PIB30_072540 [Stylosanthes scabra]|uniref:Uncharacterized protein n=1 Tax=Stylosanthes scabra TaxID=79078 RepID=A0ABU6RPL2_9FABA|nr:hypothetical protein [Stylosanthes scabra]
MKGFDRLRPEMKAWSTRFLPISAIVRATYERLQQLWIRKGQEAHAQVVAGSQWSQYLLSEIENSKGELHKMRVISCDRRSSTFIVEEVLPIRYSRQSSYRVNLRQRICDEQKDITPGILTQCNLICICGHVLQSVA